MRSAGIYSRPQNHLFLLASGAWNEDPPAEAPPAKKDMCTWGRDYHKLRSEITSFLLRPHEVLQDPSLRLNASYYITKQILPPLNRVFSLIGLDVFTW